eukprot:Skav202570  [mRNA]  locus=scaffold2177:352374:352844:+ [translate_table: standard]
MQGKCRLVRSDNVREKNYGKDTEIPQVGTSSLGTAILRTHSAGSRKQCLTSWFLLPIQMGHAGAPRNASRNAWCSRRCPIGSELQKAMRKPPRGVSKRNTAGTALGSISLVAMPQVFCTTKDWLGEVYNILLARSLCFARSLGFARNMICVESHVD